jgi:predicted transporter
MTLPTAAALILALIFLTAAIVLWHERQVEREKIRKLERDVQAFETWVMVRSQTEKERKGSE